LPGDELFYIEGSKLAPPPPATFATWGGKYKAKAGVKLPMCVRHTLSNAISCGSTPFPLPQSTYLFVTLSLLNIFEVAVFAHAQPPHAFSMASQVVI